MIIVGNFQANYGGGLPYRLRARGAAAVVVISQIDPAGLSAEEIARLVAPDPRYGVRADAVWVTPGGLP